MSKNVLAELVTKMTVESSQFKKELERTTAKTQAWSKGQQKAANDTVYSNKRLAQSFDKTNAAAKRFNTGHLSNIGYQLQDMSVQAQMGTDKLIILGQQVPQLLGSFGAFGAIAGAFVGIAAAASMALIPSLSKSEDAVSGLTETMERLQKVAKKDENGLLEFTESIKELSKVGSSVVGAELEASIIRAEKAAEQAAQSITKAFGESDAGYYLSDITDYVRALNKDLTFSVSYTDGFRETAKELGEEFGKTGDEARSLGSEIIYAIAALEKSPNAGDFEKLQKKLSDLATSGDEVSESAKLMVSDMALFFAEARSAAETAEFLTQQLEQLNSEGTVDIEVDEVKLTDAQEAVQQLAEDLALAELKAAGSTLEAEKMAFAFQLGKSTIEDLPEAAQRLLERLHQVNQQQEEAQKRLQEQSKSQSMLEGIEKMVASDSQKLQQTYDERVESLKNLVLSEEQIRAEGFSSMLELQNHYMSELDGWHEREIEAEKLKAERVNEVKREAAKRDQEMRIATEANIQSAIMSSASNIASTVQSMADEQSGIYKAAFLAQQGLAIATTIMNTEMAAVAALAPPPIGLGPVAGAAYLPWIKGLGYTSAALIGAQTIAGFRELGGPVQSGESYVIGEKGPELFTPFASGQITSNRNMERSQGGGGTGSITVQSPITIQGNADPAAIRRIISRDKTLIRAIKEAIKAPL